jgi:hypothetical protein
MRSLRQQKLRAASSSVIEGQDVSWREVIRRAGWPEGKRARVAYHLNTTNRSA